LRGSFVFLEGIFDAFLKYKKRFVEIDGISLTHPAQTA